MTLHELITANPDRFYAQTWYLGHTFTAKRVATDAPTPPTGFVALDTPGGRLPSAAWLARTFLSFPSLSLWSKHLWTSDFDDHGQRVYVGNVGPHNGHRFEIHRHLHITDQWGIPTWD